MRTNRNVVVKEFGEAISIDREKSEDRKPIPLMTALASFDFAKINLSEEWRDFWWWKKRFGTTQICTSTMPSFD
jgi:hypothetical protein